MRRRLNKLSSGIPGWIDANLSPDLDTALRAGNPIFEASCGLGSCITELDT